MKKYLITVFVLFFVLFVPIVYAQDSSNIFSTLIKIISDFFNSLFSNVKETPGSENIETEKISGDVTKIEQPQTKLQITQSELSDIVLKLSDLYTGSDFVVDKNFTLGFREEDSKSSISKKRLELGWQGGYIVVYETVPDSSSIVRSRISNHVFLYPEENITKAFDEMIERLNELYRPPNLVYKNTIDELSKPSVGDDSYSLKITFNNERGAYGRAYWIVFRKLNVLVTVTMEGDYIDYEYLKDLAKIVESKIK